MRNSMVMKRRESFVIGDAWTLSGIYYLSRQFLRIDILGMTFWYRHK